MHKTINSHSDLDQLVMHAFPKRVSYLTIAVLYSQAELLRTTYFIDFIGDLCFKKFKGLFLQVYVNILGDYFENGLASGMKEFNDGLLIEESQFLNKYLSLRIYF